MTWKFSDFCAFGFFFFFSAVMAYHYAYMKTPALDRSVASHTTVIKPWYDASFKL